MRGARCQKPFKTPRIFWKQPQKDCLVPLLERTPMEITDAEIKKIANELVDKWRKVKEKVR